MSRINPVKAETIKMEQTIYSVEWSNQKTEQLRLMTDKDPELAVLKSVIAEGWPENSKSFPKSVRSYWSMKDFLFVDDGVIVQGDRIVIPKAMQEEVLERLHNSHQGVEKLDYLPKPQSIGSE